jgi:hypothetical protein
LVEEGPFERYPTIEAKTVDPVSIATLGEIVGAGTYDDLVEKASEGREAPHGECGLLSVPPEITAALATAADADAVAASWAVTDEMAGWDRDDVREVVRELAELAKKARATGRELWFWWSL